MNIKNLCAIINIVNPISLKERIKCIEVFGTIINIVNPIPTLNGGVFHEFTNIDGAKFILENGGLKAVVFNPC